MKTSLIGAAIAFFASASALSRSTESVPSAKIDDPNTLATIIQFGPPDQKLHGLRAGDIWWRAGVDLPANISIDHIQIVGYDPVILHLKDGRCFKIDLDGDIKKLTKAQVSKTDCAPEEHDLSPWPAPVPRPGMRYVGRGWNLDAWVDEQTSKSIVTLAGHSDQPPLLTTSMHVLAIGGLGAPDAPATEVTLVGYVGRQLSIATVMLYYS
jgi:hypothetical protein